MPKSVVISLNTTGKHFTGAGGDLIEKHGTATTSMSGARGAVGCKWDLADVTRSLNSVSQICRPENGPGKADILFNNQRGVVVPPGIVDQILKKVAPIAEYPREGGLYVAEMTLSGFTRQGQDA